MSPTSRAPIAVFAYDRAALLDATLAALARCDGFAGSRVHVFCDAAATEERSSAVDTTRAVARSWCEVHGARLILHQNNLGFHNITDGITELCAMAGRVISLEDDHLPAPSFLAFLDRALDRYMHEDSVFQVAAYRMGLPLHAAPDTFFLPMPMPAGWGTWERAWQHFQWDAPAAAALLADPPRRRVFDLDDSYPASVLLERALAGTFQSYFIRWYLAMFVARGLALCSRAALVLNLGLTSGVHGLRQVSPQRQQFFNGAWLSQPYDPLTWRFPERVAVDAAVFQQLCAGLRAQRR